MRLGERHTRVENMASLSGNSTDLFKRTVAMMTPYAEDVDIKYHGIWCRESAAFAVVVPRSNTVQPGLL